MELWTSLPETDLKGQGTLELILTQVSDYEYWFHHCSVAFGQVTEFLWASVPL